MLGLATIGLSRSFRGGSSSTPSEPPANLITDPGFDNDAYWSKTVAAWTVSGSKGVFTGTGTSGNILVSTINVTPGTMFSATSFEVTELTVNAGFVQLIVTELDGGFNVYSASFSPTVGVKSLTPFTIDAGCTQLRYTIRSTNGNNVFKIDNAVLM